MSEKRTSRRDWRRRVRVSHCHITKHISFGRREGGRKKLGVWVVEGEKGEDEGVP